MHSFSSISSQHRLAPDESVCFQRRELNKILDIYGRMVSLGEWRDYAISVFGEVAVFSIYKGYGESPIYMVEKRPKLFRKNGKYSIIGADGAILKRANDLDVILSFFSRKMIKLIKLS